MCVSTNAPREHVIGLDPSLTSAGVAVCARSGAVNSGVVASPASGPLVEDRILRYRWLVSELMDWVLAARPAVVVIEGYSLGSNMSGKHDAVEFGGLLRAALVDVCPQVYEIAPTTLKKFATGKGSGKKDKIALEVFKRWGREFETHDECDAFCCAKVAEVIAGWREPSTKPQREAVETVLKKSGKQLTNTTAGG